MSTITSTAADNQKQTTESTRLVDHIINASNFYTCVSLPDLNMLTKTKELITYVNKFESRMSSMDIFNLFVNSPQDFREEFMFTESPVRSVIKFVSKDEKAREELISKFIKDKKNVLLVNLVRYYKSQYYKPQQIRQEIMDNYDDRNCKGFQKRRTQENKNIHYINFDSFVVVTKPETNNEQGQMNDNFYTAFENFNKSLDEIRKAIIALENGNKEENKDKIKEKQAEIVKLEMDFLNKYHSNRTEYNKYISNIIIRIYMLSNNCYIKFNGVKYDISLNQKKLKFVNSSYSDELQKVFEECIVEKNDIKLFIEQIKPFESAYLTSEAQKLLNKTNNINYNKIIENVKSCLEKLTKEDKIVVILTAIDEVMKGFYSQCDSISIIYPRYKTALELVNACEIKDIASLASSFTARQQLIMHFFDLNNSFPIDILKDDVIPGIVKYCTNTVNKEDYKIEKIIDFVNNNYKQFAITSNMFLFNLIDFFEISGQETERRSIHDVYTQWNIAQKPESKIIDDYLIKEITKVEKAVEIKEEIKEITEIVKIKEEIKEEIKEIKIKIGRYEITLTEAELAAYNENKEIFDKIGNLTVDVASAHLILDMDNEANITLSAKISTAIAFEDVHIENQVQTEEQVRKPRKVRKQPPVPIQEPIQEPPVQTQVKPPVKPQKKGSEAKNKFKPYVPNNKVITIPIPKSEASKNKFAPYVPKPVIEIVESPVSQKPITVSNMFCDLETEDSIPKAVIEIETDVKAQFGLNNAKKDKKQKQEKEAEEKPSLVTSFTTSAELQTKVEETKVEEQPKEIKKIEPTLPGKFKPTTGISETWDGHENKDKIIAKTDDQLNKTLTTYLNKVFDPKNLKSLWTYVKIPFEQIGCFQLFLYKLIIEMLFSTEIDDNTLLKYAKFIIHCASKLNKIFRNFNELGHVYENNQCKVTRSSFFRAHFRNQKYGEVALIFIEELLKSKDIKLEGNDSEMVYYLKELIKNIINKNINKNIK